VSFACSYLLCALRLLVVIIVVASCQSSGGDVESSVSVSPPTRAHTPLKQKKKICTCYQSCCRNKEGVTYGIRAGSTRDLGFATAFVDMSWFYYTVADRVDCVRAGNHG
jgi:hypothetical protein